MQQITIDLVPKEGRKIPTFHASQYDNGRGFRVNLKNDGVPYTLSGSELITVSVRKGDNRLVTLDVANVFGGKTYLDFESTEQMCAVAGFNFGEITLKENGDSIGSGNFMLAVEPSPEAGGLQSDSEINNLNRQITDEVDEILPDMVEDIAPAIVEEVAPSVVREVAPAVVEDVAPAILERLAPSAVESVAPSIVERLVPAEVAEVAPAVVREVAGPIVEELVPIAVGDNYYNKAQVDAIANTKADKNVKTSEFVLLAKQYTPGLITSSGYINTTSASNGFSVSTATPINGLTKITIPYDFSPSDESRLVIAFYSGTGLSSFISGVSGTQSRGLVVSVPSSANYYRISCPDNENFGIVKTITSELSTKLEINHIIDKIFSKGYALVKGDMSNGDVFEIPQTNCKNNQVYSFTAKSDDFTSLNLVIGHGNSTSNSCWITITATNCDFLNYGGTTESHAHGLTLSQFISVKIIVSKHKAAKVVLQTADNGGVYEYTLDLTNWTGASGDASNTLSTFARCVVGSLTDCVFSWTCYDFRKQLWAFGDSYFNYEATRPLYYLEQDGFYDNILVSGYGGESSEKALVALKNMLEYFGKPKYILWCMGQNDGSDTSNDNYIAWTSNIAQVINLCNDYDITPILCTIPSVPKGGGRSHELKNAWIRASGYRYVDWAEAVGAKWNNGVVTWYPNMIASDNEHTDTEGAKAIEKRMLLECPELTFEN